MIKWKVNKLLKVLFMLFHVNPKLQKTWLQMIKHCCSDISGQYDFFK